MRLDIDDNLEGYNKIASYSAGKFVIARSLYTQSIIVSPFELIADWPPQSVNELAIEHMEPLISIHPEVLLIGTGAHLYLPADAITNLLIEKNIGYEVMDTGAACRSYNFLAGEGRKVAAALFMINADSC
jgi:uncharacterized protein